MFNYLLQYSLFLFLPVALNVAAAQQDFNSQLSSGEAVAVGESGEVYLSGLIQSGEGETGEVAIYFATYNPSGEQISVTYEALAKETHVSDITLTSENEAYAVGWVTSADGENIDQGDVFVAKYAASVRVWTRRYGTNQTDRAAAVTVDDRGDVYIVGTTEGDFGGSLVGELDQFILKLNPSGAVSWLRQRSYTVTGEERANAIAVDEDGGVYLAGEYSEEPVTPNDRAIPAMGLDIFLSYYTDAGVHRWSKTIGEPMLDYGHTVAVRGEAVFVGGITPSAYGRQMEKTTVERGSSFYGFLGKYTKAGELDWLRSFGNAHDYQPSVIIPDNSGGGIVAGDGSGDLGGEELGLSDVFLLKFTPHGELIWASRFGTENYDFPKAAVEDVEGNVYVTGYLDRPYEEGISLNDLDKGRVSFLAKYTSDGEQVWLNEFDPTQ